MQKTALSDGERTNSLENSVQALIERFLGNNEDFIVNSAKGLTEDETRLYVKAVVTSTRLAILGMIDILGTQGEKPHLTLIKSDHTED